MRYGRRNRRQTYSKTRKYEPICLRSQLKTHPLDNDVLSPLDRREPPIHYMRGGLFTEGWDRDGGRHNYAYGTESKSGMLSDALLAEMSRERLDGSRHER